MDIRITAYCRLSCVPAEKIGWIQTDGGRAPKLVEMKDSSTDGAKPEYFHPCMLHFVYMISQNSRRKTLRQLVSEPKPDFKKMAREIKMNDNLDVIHRGEKKGVTKDTKIASLCEENDSLKLKLGDGLNDLNINLLNPKRKKTNLGNGLVENDEMYHIIQDAMKKRENATEEINEAMAKQLHQYYKAKNCSNMKKIKIKIEFLFNDDKTHVALSDTITDKSFKVKFLKPIILKSCSKGGRKVVLVAAKVRILTGQFRNHQ